MRRPDVNKLCTLLCTLDPFLRRIAKSTFEMTIFQLQHICYNSRHHHLIVCLPDSIPKEKRSNFTEKLVFMYPNGWWYIRKVELF